MSGSPPPSETPPPERVDYTNPWVIAVGLLPFVIIMLAVPVFWVLLPPVLVVLAILYFVYAGNLKKARALAKKHLGPSEKTELDVELSPGMTSALVLNDWGVVFTRFARRAVELAWDEITLVDEPAIATLAFHANGAVAFKADLSQSRYFLATRAIFSKIADKTSFDVDPISGQSTLLLRLQKTPMEWHWKSGHLILTSEGVEHDKGRMSWSEIERVREHSFSGDETEPYWELHFTSASLSFEVRSTFFSDGRQLGNSGYDTIKAVVAQQIPYKVLFDLPAPLPKMRAVREFERGLEATKAGMSLALKSGKFGYLERYFQHMLTLVDTFALEGSVDTQSFFRDYAELMSRTNRPEEAAKLRARA